MELKQKDITELLDMYDKVSKFLEFLERELKSTTSDLEK